MSIDTQIFTSEFHELVGAFDRLNDCILIIDPATEKIVNSNYSAEQLYGYSKEEFSALTISDISAEPLKFRQYIYSVITEGIALKFETKQIGKNRKFHYLEINPSLVTYNNNTAILCAGRDISERIAMETRLRKSEERYRMLVEGTNVITWAYDLEIDNYTYVSGYAEELIGFPVDRWFKGEFWYNIVHPDDREEILSMSNEFIKAGQNYECEYRVIDADGKIKWFKDITTVNTGGRARTLRGVLIDITERKNAEEALYKSEKQLEQVFDNAPIGKTLTGLDGRLLRVNKAFCSLLGYTKEELLNGDFQSVTHKDDLERNIDELNGAVKENKDNLVIEKRYIKKDGSIVYARTHVSILKDSHGDPDKFIAQVIDISRQKEDEEKLRATEMRLSALLNNFPDIVFYESDSSGVFMSDNVKDMLGYSAAEFAADRYLFENLMHTEDRAGINKQVRSWQVEDNPGALKFEFRVKKKDGTYIWIEDHMFGIKSEIRSYWSGYMIDVTERKSAEKKLEEIQNRLATVLTNLPNVIFYETETGRTFVSENAFNILGYSASEIAGNRTLFSNRIHPEDFRNMASGEELTRLIKQKKYVKQQFRFKKANDEYLWLEDHMYEAEKKGQRYVVGFMMDITERKQTEQRLEETQMRLAAVLNNLPNVVFYENAYGKQFISQNIFEMLGRPVEDFYMDPELFDSLIYPDDIGNIIKHTNDWYRGGAEGIYKEIFRIKRNDGVYIWLEDHMFKTQKTDGENYYSGVMIDISERKRIESAIEESLKEKELLIKEIHHRVKNNLQVVSSLLKLQSTYLKDKEALDMLLDSQNRVQSMALVHQRLYQSKDLSKINLNEYVHQLLYHVINSFGKGGVTIKLLTQIEDIKVGVDTAIPCGLIVNELVTNSIKHAFPEAPEGTIELSLKQKEENIYELIVSDNGTGFPEEMDFRNTASLGLQLVNTLVSQLEGEIELIKGGGTTFKITFKNIG